MFHLLHQLVPVCPPGWTYGRSNIMNCLHGGPVSKKAWCRTLSAALHARSWVGQCAKYWLINSSPRTGGARVFGTVHLVFVLAGVETSAHWGKATTGGGNPRNVTHPVDGPHWHCVHCVCWGRVTGGGFWVGTVCIHTVSLLECVGLFEWVSECWLCVCVCVYLWYVYV